MKEVTKSVDLDHRIPLGDFERLRDAPNSRLQKKSYDIAFEILVEGKKLTAVAAAYGMTRQRVRYLRDKVYSAYLMQPPEGWTYANICAPQEMIDRFVREADEARARYWQSRKALTIKQEPHE